jgi:TolB-like protein
MADVFISYARSTADEAHAIAAGLDERGYSVWIDDDLPAHRDFPSVIEENLRAAKAVLVIWSEDACRSRWVPAEADLAHQLGTLVQLSLDGASPPLPFNRMQCVAADGWNGDFASPASAKVLASIAELVGRTPPATPIVVKPKPAVAAAAPEQILAVLAFDNLSGDPELTYFSDGVSEEIQQTVAQGSTLKVSARSSSFQFRGADKAVRKVAAELGVTHLLDGSVRRSGSRVRISAQLVECAGETTLWADRVDGDLNDVFALQEQIAAAVAQALKVTLSATSQPALEPAVYETFLRARGLVTEGGRLYDDTADAAIPLLEAVVEAEPLYAAAWELLADARAWKLRSGRRVGEYAPGRAGVVAAAEAALRLDPKRGGAYAALAMLEPWGAYRAREALLEKALRASPNDPGVLSELSDFYWSVGRFREALRYAQQACELNPLMPAARLQVAQMRTYVGDYAASIRTLHDLHKRWPHNFPILLSLLNFACSLGFEDAYREAAPAVEAFDGWQRAALRLACQYAEAVMSGDPERREAVATRYETALDKTGTVSLNVLEAFGFLGYPERAFEMVEHASFAHVFDPDGPLPSAAFPGVILGRWSTLNTTPKFLDLADRLGLCAYWRESGRWPDCAEWLSYDLKAEVRQRPPFAVQASP